MVLALAIIIAPIAFILRRRGRRRPRTLAEAAWTRLLRRLARKGVTRQPGETPLEFSRRVAGRVRSTASGPGLVELGMTYSAVHYGEATTEQVEDFVRQTRRYRPQLNRR